MYVISLLSKSAQKAPEEKHLSFSFAQMMWHQAYKRCNKWEYKLQEIFINSKRHNIAKYSKYYKFWLTDIVETFYYILLKSI